MKLNIVCAGKIREKWLNEGMDEYIKRLSRFCSVTVLEVPDAPDYIPRAQALEKEGQAMLSKIKSGAVVFIMDVNGKSMDSETFSDHLMKAFEKGGAELYFLVGGSNGFSDSVIKRADQKICFSDMTFTHCMARLILLEQCYRAFKIAANETYHK